MERLTLACLEHLPTVVLFVADLTGECGTSVADQWKIRFASVFIFESSDMLAGNFAVAFLNSSCFLPPAFREELRARFPHKSWVDVLSKADMLGAAFAEADWQIRHQEQPVQRDAQPEQLPAQESQVAGGLAAAEASIKYGPTHQRYQRQQDELDAVRFAAALPGAVRVSSTHGEGIGTLKQAMLRMLE
jgi:nucleolar GTP-binding protein